MNSSLSWLDHSERERRRMLDVIDLFNDKDTVDELGIGTIRDALADLLFPGLSTIQTRARYFFFVPWVYMKLEQQRVPSREAAGFARKLEVQLIDALAESDDTDGVIGIDSRSKLQRLPSNIYWVGLEKYQIRWAAYSQDRYHFSLDSFYRSSKSIVTDDKEPVDGRSHLNWDPMIPPPPSDFPRRANLKLNSIEASYLSERIQNHNPGSLWAFLVDRARPAEPCDFIWLHPQISEVGKGVSQQVTHARAFSELMFGAALLYNLLLARACKSEERSSQYEQEIQEWRETVTSQMQWLSNWNRSEFWALVRGVNPRISLSSQQFVESWMDLVFSPTLKNVESYRVAQDLIFDREIRLKRHLARLKNPRAQELWRGASGAFQLNYRWNVAQRLLRDIQLGRMPESNRA
jgi:hypothetical protein